ncbi:hypothetical protein FM117_09605 [Micrococcus luteus Mu201]|nr:hypothetical protein FM117_09605 [Micrococcus luteus Mu201]
MGRGWASGAFVSVMVSIMAGRLDGIDRRAAPERARRLEGGRAPSSS